MVSTDELWGHDVLALASTTGMPLTIDSPAHGGKEAGTLRMAGGEIKWCGARPHRKLTTMLL